MQNTRSFVIEHAIIVEGIISKTLGILLDIDWEKSKSFGHQSTSFSFNQKVQIIQDLKGIEKGYIQKFTDLMSIRNKFAHVQEINSFGTLFSLAGNGQTIKKNLERWYLKPENSTLTQDTEVKYKWMFEQLVCDLGDLLIQLVIRHSQKKGYALGQQETAERLLYELINEVKKLDNGQKIVDTVVKRVKDAPLH